MILFLLAGISIWLLATLFSHAVKGTVPSWMQKYMYIDRYSLDHERQDNTGYIVRWLPIVLILILGPFFIIYFFYGLTTPNETWASFKQDTFLSTTSVILGLVTPFYLGNYIRGHFSRYTVDTVEEEKKEELRHAYGAKDWASPELINQSLGSDGTGLHVGSHFTFSSRGHMMTVGGSRGGKGVNLILPALLANTLQKANAPSFVVLDPKGENLAVAGEYLQKAGYNVFAVNPFAIPEIVQFGNARFNPFELFTSDDPDFDKYADMIAYALIPEASHANDYFDKSARNYITLYIRHMMTQDEEPKNFRTLYKWLRLAGPKRTALLQKMSFNDAFDGDINDEAMAIFGQLVNDGGRTVEGIYSTVRTATDVFKDMQLRDSVSASDIDLKTLAKEKTAVFVCLSPADLDRCQSWLRLFFGSVIRGLQKYYNPSRRVVLLMDEFPTLGALKEFEIAAGFLAGFNVTLWPIMQDLTQLKNLYPNSWETFVNNAIVRHYLAIGDNFTADYISKRMPKVLRFVRDKPEEPLREILKPLLEPHEVMSWPYIIMEVKGMDRPASLMKMAYWDINKNGAPNPFYSK